MWSKFCVVFDRCGPTFVWFLVYVVQLRCVWPHHAPLLSSASSRPPITSPCPLLINTTATTSSIRTISSGAVFLSSGHHTSCKSIWIYLKNTVKLIENVESLVDWKSCPRSLVCFWQIRMRRTRAWNNNEVKNLSRLRRISFLQASTIQKVQHSRF